MSAGTCSTSATHLTGWQAARLEAEPGFAALCAQKGGGAPRYGTVAAMPAAGRHSESSPANQSFQTTAPFGFAERMQAPDPPSRRRPVAVTQLRARSPSRAATALPATPPSSSAGLAT